MTAVTSSEHVSNVDLATSSCNADCDGAKVTEAW